MTNSKTERNRRALVDMATGQRSGFWVEVLHDERTGAEVYAVHEPAGYPNAQFRTDWGGIRAYLQYSAGDAEIAETLPRYDDGRTCNGYEDTKNMTAICTMLKNIADRHKKVTRR